MTYSRGLDRPRRIFLAVPTYSGQVGAGFLASLFESQILLHAAGIGVDLCIEAGNCHVDDARNALVRQFLQTDCSDLVFLDADISWQAEDLLKLVRYDRDVVAGVYPKKQDEEDFPVLTLPGAIQADPESNYELVEVEGAPTGFLRLSRASLEAMSSKAKTFMGQGAKPGDKPYCLLFERIIQEGRRMSGDYAFCWKWRQAGGKIWVAPEMAFGHEGQAHWSGRLGDFWRSRAHLENPDLYAAIRRLASGDDSPEIFLSLSQAWGNHWAASPEFLATCYKLAIKAEGPILETGSGLSTLVLGVAAAKRGVRLLSLECSLKWHQRVTAALRQAGIPADVEYSPLQDYAEGAWYEALRSPDLFGIEPFGLVVCDGPSRKDGDRALLLQVPNLSEATILADDAEDPACLAPLETWSKGAGRKLENLGAFALSYKEKQ